MDIHLDPLGGIAGDMFVAAMIDLVPELEHGLLAALAKLPLLEGVNFALSRHNDGILTGKRFSVFLEDGTEERSQPISDRHHSGHHHHGHHDHVHGNGDHLHQHHEHHEHSHVSWKDISRALRSSALERTTIEHALGIFSLLAQAEAQVHGKDVDAVTFHEVGAWDSIADIVAAAWIIAELHADNWTVGPIPIGSGRVKTAHGLLPVPAPATAILLEGFATFDDGIPGERVTPTGAAILAYLQRDTPVERRPRVLRRTSHGFGTKTLPGISNCLRAIAFETVANAGDQANQVKVLECEIDDQTAEELSHAVDHLRAAPGVIDIVQYPVFGKKGRMMSHLRLLVEPSASDQIMSAVFDETTTIGIRHSLVDRKVLGRRKLTVAYEGESYDLKAVDRPTGISIKLEADHLVEVGGNLKRRKLRSSIETIAQQAEDQNG